MPTLGGRAGFAGTAVSSPAQELVPRQRSDHRGQLGAALAAGESEPQGLEVAADRLQLADDRARLDARLDQVAKAAEGLRRFHVDVVRLEHDVRVLARLGEVAGTAQDGHERDGNADAHGELVVRKRRERVDGQTPQARGVEMYVVPRQAELVEVGANRLGGDAGLPNV